jgi:2-polyprenyl-6-methoxyphenol hydroxylase-like FAD-dependent oxidoreductase
MPSAFAARVSFDNSWLRPYRLGQSFPRVASKNRMANRQAVVLVVGAGPTGLLLAAELNRRGVPCHLIDARPAPLHWDRATVVHPRSLQIFESLGLVDRFLDEGCRQRVIKIHSDGELLGTLDLSGCGSIYGFNVGVSEEVTESILIDFLHQHGGQVNRSSRLVGLTVTPDNRVLADIERDGERYHVEARWVVGCDGLHSATRELSGIGFEGHDIPKSWAVFDTTVQGWADTFEGNFVYLESLPIILTALPGRRWRVYLRPGADDSDLVADAASTLHRYAPSASFVDIENPTRFHCHTRMATKFRSGPIFLAGDAAHLCSPAEGHGMNCGLQDAFNLAWKLALVHEGTAHEALLDSYEIERRPAAEIVTKSGDASEHALTMADPTERQSRNQTIKTNLADAKIRQHDIVAETELNIDYSGSPIVFGDANSYFAAGHRLPDHLEVRMPDAVPSRLHALGRRAGNTLLLLGGPAADASTLLALHNTLQGAVRDSTLFEAAVTVSSRDDVAHPIGRLETAAASRLGIEGSTVLALRPDGYVGLRSDRDHLNALERYSAFIQAGSSS